MSRVVEQRQARVGAKPVPVPKGVEVHLEGTTLSVRGPQGSLTQTFHPDMRLLLEDGVIRVERPSDAPFHRALHGTTRALINNLLLGVTQGYRKVLEITGVGYRAQQAEGGVVLQVGYSHLVEFKSPAGIKVALESANRIVVSGPDKQQVGQVAAQIRRVRPPDRYKGKGIRYAGEVVRLKPGKAAVRKQ